MEQLIETLRTQRDLSDEELTALITRESDDKDLFAAADAVRREHYGSVVFCSGLIVFTTSVKMTAIIAAFAKAMQQATAVPADAGADFTQL